MWLPLASDTARHSNTQLSSIVACKCLRLGTNIAVAADLVLGNAFLASLSTHRYIDISTYINIY